MFIQIELPDFLDDVEKSKHETILKKIYLDIVSCFNKEHVPVLEFKTITKMQKYVFRKDDDCHWYLLTVEEADEFDKLMKMASKAKEGSSKWHDICHEISKFNRIDNPNKVSFQNPHVF